MVRVHLSPYNQATEKVAGLYRDLRETQVTVKPDNFRERKRKAWMLIENRIRVHDRLKKENHEFKNKSGFSVISKAGNKSIKISSSEINKS